jgi:hypothetical protein
VNSGWTTESVWVGLWVGQDNLYVGKIPG